MFRHLAFVPLLFALTAFAQQASPSSTGKAVFALE